MSYELRRVQAVHIRFYSIVLIASCLLEHQMAREIDRQSMQKFPSNSKRPEAIHSHLQ